MHFEFPKEATPIADSGDLLIPWVQNMRDLNRVEAENIALAQKKYLNSSSSEVSDWFCYKELQAIHLTMFEKVWVWAGKQRKSITSIGVTPGLIPIKMAELCEEVVSWAIYPVELTFLEKSARVHHRLVQIHPFENGNGRFSRLVADKCLLSWKCTYPLWPEGLQKEGTTRKKYISSLKAADKGDYEPLIDFMKDLGASEPKIEALFSNKFYFSYVNSQKGIKKVAALLRRGENPTILTEGGHRLLQVIIKSKINSNIKLSFIKLLLQAGSQVDAIDKSGLTPFQTAIQIGDKTIADFLKSKGARDTVPLNMYAKYYNIYFQMPLP